MHGFTSGRYHRRNCKNTMVDFPELVARFNDHLAMARNTPGIIEPSAFALATVGPANRPSVRIMLLKAVDPRGFVEIGALESWGRSDDWLERAEQREGKRGHGPNAIEQLFV